MTDEPTYTASKEKVMPDIIKVVYCLQLLKSEVASILSQFQPCSTCYKRRTVCETHLSHFRKIFFHDSQYKEAIMCYWELIPCAVLQKNCMYVKNHSLSG